ncbi:MAG TPA: hypothetical protein EYO75_07610 [Sulfurimonas sp.]|nr:hypothetical protein [Sulfurimonas sp.]HIM76259.1 hypothetical protein [Campylobacterales bacterium]
MKKIVLSVIAALTFGCLSVSADEIKLYQNANGQVFTTSATDRTPIDMINLSGARKSITIIDKKSPDFLLGKQTHINMKFVADDNSDMWLKAGVRIQGTFENIKTDDKSVENKDTSLSEAYLRRVRFEVAAGFGKHASFVMDIRNDKSNYGIENTEGSFSVGDAYVKIKKPFGTSLVNFKLYRAKIDVSRTETVKSARVVAYDRPYIADSAAQYISFNRRGTNAQVYGNWEHKIQYQLAAGAATSPDKTISADADKGTGINLTEQSFFIGGKVKASPFDGWEELQNTETYMGQGKHFTLGAAYWMIPTMKGANANGNNVDLKRSLINVEASMHYKGFMVQAEYFKFNDMVKEWNTAVTIPIETGTSDGWYATTEYVFTDFYFVAPFARYESWDRFNGSAGYEVTSALVGVNWYLRGNTTKVGLVAQKDTYGVNTGDKDVTKVRVTSQWFF